jgi:DNA-binding PadR family transcriptional regulator
MLAERPMHGYELIRLMEDQFLGLYTPSAGTIYPRLAALESEGLVTHEEEDGRKVYRLTDAGRAEVEARRTELDAVRQQAAEAARTAGHFARQLGEEVRSSIGELRGEWKDLARQAQQQERRARRHAREAWEQRPHIGADAPWDLARRWDWDAFGDLMQEWGERFGAVRPRRGEGGADEPDERPGDRGTAAPVEPETPPAETPASGTRAASGRPTGPPEEPAEGRGWAGRLLAGDLQDFVGDVASAVRALELDPERVGRLREALGAAREAVLSALHGSPARSDGDPAGPDEETGGEQEERPRG